jgi:hypothetical protein
MTYTIEEKTKIAEPYISALEEQNKVNKSWRAFQNFLEATDFKLLQKINTQVNEIEKIISEERDLYQ